MTLEELRTAIEQQAALMVAVATGGPQINSVQAAYTDRRDAIRSELTRRQLEDPNPFGDLWAWYGYWSANLSRYHERRTYIREMYEPLLTTLDALAEERIGARLVEEDRTGWERVDDQVVQLRQRYSTVESPEDAQAVGLLCRDIFVSLDEAVFDPGQHVSEGGDAPSTLIDRLLAVIAAEAPGSSNEELRRLLKATVDYANKVQHDRAATRRQARIAAEATLATVHMLRALVVDESEPVPE